MDVSVTFSSTKIPYIYLNDYNIGMLKFILKTENKPLVLLNNPVGSDEETELKNINEDIIFNTFQSHYYDLK